MPNAICQDLKRHLWRETVLHKQLNSAQGPSDISERYAEHFAYTRKVFGEHGQIMRFQSDILSLHDGFLEVASERRVAGKFHVFLRGNAYRYDQVGKMRGQIPLEIRLVSNLSLRSINRRDIHQFVFLPSQGALGVLLRENEGLRVLVAEIDQVELLIGEENIQASREAKLLQERTLPQSSLRSRPRARM